MHSGLVSQARLFAPVGSELVLLTGVMERRGAFLRLDELERIFYRL